MTFVGEIIFFSAQNLYLFFSLLFFLRRFSSKSKIDIIKSIGRLLMVTALFICMRYVVRYYFLTKLLHEAYGKLPFDEWFISGVLWIINYFFIASAYFYFQSSIQKQRHLLKNQEEKLIKEKESIQLENTALRAQINPHFLYNTLDFLYAKSLSISAEMSDSVMKLSDIMRYALKPQDADGLVYLSDETAHVRNIIEMNQLRFNNNLNVHFEIENVTDNVRIIPLLLITLVENVFKHGVINSREHPAAIVLFINDAQQLHFRTSNRKRIGPKEHSSGIGLDNTFKRLKNTYGDRCDMQVESDTDCFAVEVCIQLYKDKNNYFS